jgi:hypothetical protein
VEPAAHVDLGLTAEDHVHRVTVIPDLEDRLPRRVGDGLARAEKGVGVLGPKPCEESHGPEGSPSLGLFVHRPLLASEVSLRRSPDANLSITGSVAVGLAERRVVDTISTNAATVPPRMMTECLTFARPPCCGSL